MAHNRVQCLRHDCDYEWSPERDTPARGFKHHIDPTTKEKVIYSKCPKCGHRWFAYERTPDSVRRKRVRGRGVDIDRTTGAVTAA